MSHDDFAIEPVKGLPEEPPLGERILWQGQPNWWVLAKESLNLYWVLAYFLGLGIWRFLTLIDQVSFASAFQASFPFAILGGIVCGLLLIVAIVQAKATVYTITNRRVAMRIGAALTVTLNLPYTQIKNANLDLRRAGTGTIVFDLMGDTRISYLVCWPHVRPWKFNPIQPALRCIPEAEKVAQLLSEAAEARVSVPQIKRIKPQSAVAAE